MPRARLRQDRRKVAQVSRDSAISETAKGNRASRVNSRGNSQAANPANYYVNLHSPEFPKGAIRGQTALVSGNGDQLAFTGGPMSKGLMLLGLCVIAAGSTLLAVGGQRRRVAYHRPRH